MDLDQFRAWVGALANADEIDQDQAEDLVRQRILFDQSRSEILAEFDRVPSEDEGQVEMSSSGIVVGYQNDERIVADSVIELLSEARERSDYSLVYFEPIGFNPFGNAFGEPFGTVDGVAIQS